MWLVRWFPVHQIRKVNEYTVYPLTSQSGGVTTLKEAFKYSQWKHTSTSILNVGYIYFS